MIPVQDGDGTIEKSEFRDAYNQSKVLRQVSPSECVLRPPLATIQDPL